MIMKEAPRQGRTALAAVAPALIHRVQARRSVGEGFGSTPTPQPVPGQ